MVMPYNLRKISRYPSEMDATSEPRCTYACTSSSSSSSCSSSQSSQAPSPTNLPITQDLYNPMLPDASQLVFGHQLTFDETDSDDDCNNAESSSNFTLVDHETSAGNETLQQPSPVVTNWFGGVRTRSRSRSYTGKHREFLFDFRLKMLQSKIMITEFQSQVGMLQY